MNFYLEKYKGKYRRESIRLPGWDYANQGIYFVTVCTENRINFFGKIENNRMILNELGVIVDQEWRQTIFKRQNIELDKYVVMPNHIHGIVIIKYKMEKFVAPVAAHCNVPPQHCNVQPPWFYKNKFGPQSNNLSAIIRGFKGATTNVINQEFPDKNFAWQTKFYEQIIRTEQAFANIRKYIENNPSRWYRDRNKKTG